MTGRRRAQGAQGTDDPAAACSDAAQQPRDECAVSLDTGRAAWVGCRRARAPGRERRRWTLVIRTYGPNAVDWEQRIDLDRLRGERLERLRKTLQNSSLGALLTFDFANIRYLTATHIGTWAMD